MAEVRRTASKKALPATGAFPLLHTAAHVSTPTVSADRPPARPTLLVDDSAESRAVMRSAV
jgi:hypothetical protein